MHPVTQIFVNLAALAVLLSGSVYLVKNADPSYLKIIKTCTMDPR